MPDGFEPRQQLARLTTLRDMMQGCRERAPKIMQVLDDALEDEDIMIRLHAAQICLDRGYGKPMRQVNVSIDNSESNTSKRVVILENNNRQVQHRGPVIDVDSGG
jgi:hypothetical protein